MNQRIMSREDAARIAEARAALRPVQQETTQDAPHQATSQVPGLRERLAQVQATLRQEEQALAEIARQLEAARTAHDQRQRLIAEHEQEAARIAQENLAAGRGEASKAERAADEQAQRLRRELARADAALAILNTQQGEAARKVQAAASVAEQARLDLDKAQAADTAAQMHAEIRALVDKLGQLTAEGRAHNRQVLKLMQEWSRLNGNGQPIADTEARARGVHMLFLPGALIPAPTDNRAALLQGFSLRFAPDLVSHEIAEDMALRQ